MHYFQLQSDEMFNLISNCTFHTLKPNPSLLKYIQKLTPVVCVTLEWSHLYPFCVYNTVNSVAVPALFSITDNLVPCREIWQFVLLYCSAI